MRKRIDPLAPDFNDDTPEVNDMPSNRYFTQPRTPDEVLYADFNIRPGLPIQAKIEHLTLIYRLNPMDVARLLEVSISTVNEEMVALQALWLELGRIPDQEDRQMARGRMYAELTRIKAEIDTVIATVDPTEKSKLLTLKLNLLDRMNKLTGLDIDKRDAAIPADDTVSDPITEAVNNLNDEQKGKLYARFKALG